LVCRLRNKKVSAESNTANVCFLKFQAVLSGTPIAPVERLG
jgi:hypothetical protein